MVCEDVEHQVWCVRMWSIRCVGVDVEHQVCWGGCGASNTLCLTSLYRPASELSAFMFLAIIWLVLRYVPWSGNDVLTEYKWM